MSVPKCEKCGFEMGVEIEPGRVICSSDYIGGPLCYTCQVEHCMETNCLSCDMGKYPECEHLDRKKFYMEED